MSGVRPTPILTEEEASLRSASVESGLLYRIFINFQKGESYNGLVRIEFRLKNADNVFIDFAGDSVSSVNLNGQEGPTETKDGRLNLNKEHLNAPGKLNILHIKFANRYYTDGCGIHTYSDVDGSQYLYTQSEPYWGNRIFPMLDQPDLKAEYILHAAAPSEWMVLASVPCKDSCTWQSFVDGQYGSDYYRLLRTEFAEIPTECNWWQFDPSVLLSTYLLNVVVGPFEAVHLEESKRYRGLPMAIYGRKSLMEYVRQEAHNIFEFNKRGIEYYEGFFNLEYCFPKLDTIFCPEFNSGAMEYPGAVTYSERLLPKKKNTVSMVSSRGMVILHELAHMWFGNAVTMRWWDGLWLNESFADFVCYMALEWIQPKLDFEIYDPWLSFHLRKGWGYKEDQEKTTHKIATCVVNTQVADNIFDGITYSKGAASLRQLVALVGEERFAAACSEYFQEHKFNNTDLVDLLDAFKNHLGGRASEHKAYDLDNWQASWLETAGTNTVQAQWTPGSDSLVLKQGAALEDHATLRYHRIDVALYNAAGEVVKVQEVILEAQEETVVQIDGGISDAVVAVLPNYNDYSFIKVVLDQTSQTWFEANVGKITVPLAKGLILRALYDGVRDANYKASAFVNSVSTLLATETNNQIIDMVFRFIGGAIKIIPGSKYSEYAHKLYQAARKLVLSAEEPTFKLSMVEKMFSYCFHEDDIEDLKSWYEGSSQDLGDNSIISISQKWQVVYFINGSSKYSAEEKKAALDKLLEEDESDVKLNWKLKIDALNADAEKREELFKEYFNQDSSMSWVQLRSSIIGFTSKFIKTEVKQTYFDRYFDQIIDAMKIRGKQVSMVRHKTNPYSRYCSTTFSQALTI